MRADCFEAYADLPRRWRPQTRLCMCLGFATNRAPSIRRSGSPLSVQTFRPRLRAWGYSNQLVPAMLAANLDVLSVHGLWKYCSVGSRRWHRQTDRPYVVHPDGMLEPWALRNADVKKRIAALLYENQHLRAAACLRALSEAEALSFRS